MRPTPRIKSDSNYIFKVVVLTDSDVILSDLGGIRLRSKSTIDLGKKFDLEQIKKSRSLAENIWNGTVWAWDTLGNQIGGRDFCEVETNLLESGTCDSKDIVIVNLEGCATDVISEYVAISFNKEGIFNAFQRGGKEDRDNLQGLWFAYPVEAEGVDPYKPTTNYLKSLEWTSFESSRNQSEAEAEVDSPVSVYDRPNFIYMLDRKTQKVYILTEKRSKESKNSIGYIRETLKNVLCDDCEKTSIVFGTNVPDACDTYLYNNFGVSSNISPYLVTGAQSLCGLTISYQSASLKDGNSVPARDGEIFSPYRLWIEANGIRQFYIPLPGGDWQGRYLDLCNPSPLNVVEFFEGRSELWRKLNEYYTTWKDEKDKIYEQLVSEGCVLGVYMEGKKEQSLLNDLGNSVNKYVIDSRINADLHKALEREMNALPPGDKAREELINLFSTGNRFYDEFIKFLYLIQRRMLFNADKIAIYVDCNDEVKAAQSAESKESAWNNYIFCESISNINLTLNFCNYCDVKPISEIDGRVWGKVTDEKGIGISGAELYFPKWDWSVSTDDNGNYLFLDVLFGDAGELQVVAQGYIEDTYSGVIVSEDVPSVEVNFSLTTSLPGEPNIISGYIRDFENKGIENADVLLNFKELNASVVTNSDGYYEYQIPSNMPQLINVYASKEGVYSQKGASANYDGSSNVNCDLQLTPIINLTVGVVGATGQGFSQTINSTVTLSRKIQMGSKPIWSQIGYFDINNGNNQGTFFGIDGYGPSIDNLYQIEVSPMSGQWLGYSTVIQTQGSTSLSIVLEKNTPTIELYTTGNIGEGGYLEGDGTYEYGSTVEIEAFAGTDATFINWTRVSDGTEFSNSSYVSFTITESLKLNANFSSPA